MDTTTVKGTVKDNGVIDISFKEGEEEDNYAKFAGQNENCQDIDCYYNENHRTVKWARIFVSLPRPLSSTAPPTFIHEFQEFSTPA